MMTADFANPPEGWVFDVEAGDSIFVGPVQLSTPREFYRVRAEALP